MQLASQKDRCLPKKPGPKGTIQHARISSLEDGPNVVELARNRGVHVTFQLVRLEDVAHLGLQGFDVVAITYGDSVASALSRSLGSGTPRWFAARKGLQQAMHKEEG